MCRFANVLKGLGVKKGDVVAVYMPLVPELAIALLACARIGAPHTVIFGGFSSEALAGRIQDCQAKVLVTADGGYRRGKIVPLKEHADGAAALARPSPRSSSIAGPATTSPWRRAATTGGTSSPQNVSADLPPRAARQRTPPVHPLHLGLDGQAEGDPAHDRRLPARHGADLEVGLRPQGRRHLLLHRRHRLGDRPFVPRLRPAGQRRHLGDVRRARRTGPTRVGSGRSSRTTGSRSSTPRRPRSARS